MTRLHIWYVGKQAIKSKQIDYLESNQRERERERSESKLRHILFQPNFFLIQNLPKEERINVLQNSFFHSSLLFLCTFP